MKTTTPSKIDKKIIELCNEISIDHEPEYIRCISSEKSRVNECFDNVDSKVNESGGKRILGWTIWKWSNVMVEAEAHAIWETPLGEYIDITPHQGETEILFLRDDKLIFEGCSIGSHRKALTESLLVKELIRLCDIRDNYLCETEGNYVTIPSQLIESIQLLGSQINMTVGRNELCPCDSGLKYKKCCGSN